MSQPLAAPLRVVVIDGNEDEREATIALCRQCGLLMNAGPHCPGRSAQAGAGSGADGGGSRLSTRFGLSLDDFGAGHASLLRLSRFPFNELKLDRRLVHEASRRPHIKPLLRHAIATARELGVTSVAEGVETEPDLLLLRELGCDLAQGYLIARPMRAAALLDWHLQWVREHAYPDATRSQVLPLRCRCHTASAPGTGRKG